MMDGTEKLLAEAAATLQRVEGERAQAQAQHRQVMALYDEEVRRLRAVIRTLTPEEQPRRKRTAAVQAGPKALAKVRAALAVGPLPQAEIVRVTGLNDGTVSYALRALTVELHEVEPTGVLVGGSREFRLAVAERVA